MRKKAYFIAIEGIEGVGKTTLAGFIAQYFADHGYEAKCTREPGGTDLAEQVRVLLKDPAYKINSVTELLLMFASRSHHIETVIKPSLQQGISIISDRYVDASYAYQGAGRGIEDEIIDQLTQVVCKDLMPNFTILITCSPDIAMQRVAARQEGIDRIEQEQLVFFENAQNKYLELAAKRGNYIVINGEDTLDKVKKTLEKKLKALVNL